MSKRNSARAGVNQAPTLTMTLGLPASGKSTWASQEALESKGNTVRITKDMLRIMLNGTPEGRGKKERNVLDARNLLISGFLAKGLNVIVDDTNFNPIHETHLRELAASAGAMFSIEDFTRVPLEECIKRDAKRANPVGETVIRRMWQQYLYKTPQLSERDESLPDAIIVDVDGTLAIMGNRSPFAWDKVHLDSPNPSVVWMVKAAYQAGAAVLYVSGRDGACAGLTREWLNEHVGIDGPLWTRDAGDTRKDFIVKEELYRNHIEGLYNIVTVFDDRDQVVRLWRDTLGLPCFQVNYGSF